MAKLLKSRVRVRVRIGRVRVRAVYKRNLSRLVLKIHSGDNQGGRLREQKKSVRVRTLFERFFYKITKLFQDKKPRSRLRLRSV